MDDIKVLMKKTAKTLKEEGVVSFARKVKNYGKVPSDLPIEPVSQIYKDVLFINGCGESVPHPARYRVSHQREQLESHNISTDQVFYVQLQLDQVRFYRTFIFFRCPYTDTIGEFIKLAKSLNKKVLFDIDDLVIDTKYTDDIKYLQTLSKEEKALYDDGVMRMGKTLQLCDGAITTTERLANELKKYVPEVFINRNTASEEMCALSEEALKCVKRNSEKVRIGYFSGSLTHNDDFLLVLPALAEVMRANPNVELHICGELDLPEELGGLETQVVTHPFVDWRRLPQLIAEVDINIAPLEEGIFNEAKSENKWVEAALVKVPTIASNVGAFARMIQNDITGILCTTKEEWREQLERLVENKEERSRIAESAYQYCKKNCVTIYTGSPLRNFVCKYMTPNYAFALPSLNISGGIMVAIKHAIILQDQGYDVMLLNDNEATATPWCEYENHKFPVLGQDIGKFNGRIDTAIATMWTTMAFVERYYNIEKRKYLVQGYETDFYPNSNPLRIQANRTYFPTREIQFLTISKWCQKWLKERYGQIAEYAPDGLDVERYQFVERKDSGKCRILIEGDCAVDYKNIDEAFIITNSLDKSKYEIWYMSYNGEPKEWYQVDRFLHKVPYEEVHQVYEQCDILLKTSILESFSYPPLEMMATGGYVVAVPNGGNREYLKNEENCLLYEQGNIEEAKQAIERICHDGELQETLKLKGRKTAEQRSWDNIRKDILRLYQ